MRVYTMMHWCLVYEGKLCGRLEAVGWQSISQDEWLNDNILKPYGALLRKICQSEEMYLRVGLEHPMEFDFEIVFYLVSLLQHLFEAVKKISPLARYYRGSSK